MKKMVGLAVLAGAAALATGAQAQSISANVTLTSDYVFRGLSLSGEDPAVQGGFDFEHGLFYAGVWGSSLGAAGSSMEMDVYGGFRPQVGPLALDIGIIGYLYPGADDNVAEFDFWEGAVSAEMEVAPQLTLGAGINFSPDMYGETGDALYININAEYAVNDQLAFSAVFGNQRIDDVNGPLAGAPDDSYNTWNLGGTYAVHGFELDLRYHDSNISSGDPIITNGFIPLQWTDGRLVLSISRSL